MHIVTCQYCKKQFDRDKEEAIMVSSRRYIHASCASDQQKQEIKEQQDLSQLETYIMTKYNLTTISAKIKKQIRDFRKDYSYTYSGMLKTLIWWFDIKKNSTDKAKTYGGIGIIPFVYDEAKEYYHRLWLLEELNRLSDIEIPTPKNRVVVEIPPPQAENKPMKLFNI